MDMDIRLQLWGKILSPVAEELLANGTQLSYVRELYMSPETEPIEVQRRLAAFMARTVNDRAAWESLLTFLDSVYKVRGVAAWDIQGAFAARFNDAYGAPQAMPILSYRDVSKIFEAALDPQVPKRILPTLQVEHLSMVLGGWLTCDDDEIRNSEHGIFGQDHAAQLIEIVERARPNPTSTW